MKYVVLYSRVSTEEQNEQMQLAAAQNYIKGIPTEQLIKLTDHGVSALKVEMKQRPNFKKLLDLIEQDKVSTLVVYHRDRLARNFYEYIDIVRSIVQHEVEVIFTSFKCSPFTYDIQIEGIYGILSQQEGANIDKRTRDAQALYPNTIIGYEVIKDKSSKKKAYQIDSNYSAKIKEMFLSISEVTSKEDFFSLLEKYKRLFKRKNTDKVLTLLQKPFYAGLKENGGYYTNLDHAPTIIDPQLFYKVQEVITFYDEDYSLEKVKEAVEKLFTPTCGVCGSKMVYPKKRLGQEGMFCCSKDHKNKKVMIPYGELEECLVTTTEEYLNNLNLKQIEWCCHNFLHKNINQLQQEASSKTNQMKKLYLKIALHGHSLSSKKFMNELSLIEKEVKSIKVKLEKCIKGKDEMKSLIKLIKSSLQREMTKSEKLDLSQKFFPNISIYPDKFVIDATYSQFIKEGELFNAN
ncbi:MAG: recombinase family protein [Bacillota bacterium]|nr:recombinase family protein [Bacillota bacterium]